MIKTLILSFEVVIIYGNKLESDVYRGVSRIFIIGFPTSGVGRYLNRSGEATS